MNCLNCGSPVPEGNRFCSHCGAAVPVSDPSPGSGAGTSVTPVSGSPNRPRMGASGSSGPSNPSNPSSPSMSPGAYGSSIPSDASRANEPSNDIPSGGAYSGSNGSSSVSTGVRILRKLAKTPQFMVGTIAYTLSIVLSLYAAGTTFSTFLNQYLGLLGTSGFNSSEIDDFVNTLQGYTSAADSYFFLFAVITNIPAILTALGLWLIFSAGRNKRKNEFSTAGLTIIHVITVIECVLYCIISAITVITLVILTVEMSSYPGNDTEVLPMLLAVDLLILIIGVVLPLLFFFKLIGMLGGAKKMAVTGKPVQKASVYVGVIVMLSALPNLASLITSPVAGKLLALCSGISAVCFSMLIFSFRSRIAAALLSPEPVSAAYDNSSAPGSYESASPASAGFSPYSAVTESSPYSKDPAVSADPSPYNREPAVSSDPFPYNRDTAVSADPSPYRNDPADFDPSPYGNTAAGGAAGPAFTPYSTYGSTPASEPGPYGSSPASPGSYSKSTVVVANRPFASYESSPDSGAASYPGKFSSPGAESYGYDERNPYGSRPAGGDYNSDINYGSLSPYMSGFETTDKGSLSMDMSSAGPSSRLKGSLLDSLHNPGKNPAGKESDGAPSRLSGSLLNQARNGAPAAQAQDVPKNADFSGKASVPADVPPVSDKNKTGSASADVPGAAFQPDRREDPSTPEQSDAYDSDYNPGTVYATPYDSTLQADETIRQIPARLLRVRNNKETIINVPLLRMGRSSSLSDYIIDNNPAVGRHHADIVCHNNAYYIIDRNSVNHVYVDRQIIPPEEEIPLNEKAEIRLADEVFLFKIDFGS